MMSARHYNASLKVGPHLPNSKSNCYRIWELTSNLGLSDVERAFVHVDYEDAHDVATEHKALYEVLEPKEPLSKRIKQKFTRN